MAQPQNQGTVFDVPALVSYQEGAIVTRIVVRSPKGSATMFACDEGQELSEHTAPFDAFVHVLEGEAEIGLGGKIHRLSGGQGIVMPANQPHSVKAVARVKMMLTMIKEQ